MKLDWLCVKVLEAFMNVLEKRFGNESGYDIARQFMEDNNIEFH